MARNLELKVRLADLPAARKVASAVATSRIGLMRQMDTYFRVREGRLKLREIEPLDPPGELSRVLIAYFRPGEAGVRTSEYELVPVSEESPLLAILAANCGTEVVVRKRREVFLHHNVRIHLDEVDALGDYLEFEAVISPDCNEALSRRRLEFLIEAFGLDEANGIAGSYCDLLAAQLAKL